VEIPIIESFIGNLSVKEFL